MKCPNSSQQYIFQFSEELEFKLKSEKTDTLPPDIELLESLQLFELPVYASELYVQLMLCFDGGFF